MAWSEEDLRRILERGQAHVVGSTTTVRHRLPIIELTPRASRTLEPSQRIVLRLPMPMVDAARQQYANKLEEAYALFLETRRLAGEVVRWWYEPFSLRLARKTFYRPDFLVQYSDGALEVHETKGHWKDDARVKIKVAADKYACFHFVAIQRKNGAWVQEHF